MNPLDIAVRCDLHPAAAAADCPRCASVGEMNQENERIHRPEIFTVKKEWVHDPAEAKRGP